MEWSVNFSIRVKLSSSESLSLLCLFVLDSSHVVLRGEGELLQLTVITTSQPLPNHSTCPLKYAQLEREGGGVEGARERGREGGRERERSGERGGGRMGEREAERERGRKEKENICLHTCTSFYITKQCKYVYVTYF